MAEEWLWLVAAGATTLTAALVGLCGKKAVSKGGKGAKSKRSKAEEGKEAKEGKDEKNKTARTQEEKEGEPGTADAISKANTNTAKDVTKVSKASGQFTLADHHNVLQSTIPGEGKKDEPAKKEEEPAPGTKKDNEKKEEASKGGKEETQKKTEETPGTKSKSKKDDPAAPTQAVPKTVAPGSKKLEATQMVKTTKQAAPAEEGKKEKEGKDDEKDSKSTKSKSKSKNDGETPTTTKSKVPGSKTKQVEAASAAISGPSAMPAPPELAVPKEGEDE